METTTMTAMQERATWYLQHFERTTRDDGAQYWRQTAELGSEDYEAIQTMSMHAHGDMFPDDDRYRFIVDALNILAECEDEDEYAECLDSNVDVYTNDLLKWLGSDAARPSYVDEAAAEYGSPSNGIIQQIAMGQYMERREVLDLVRAYIEDEIA